MIDKGDDLLYYILVKHFIESGEIPPFSESLVFMKLLLSAIFKCREQKKAILTLFLTQLWMPQTTKVNLTSGLTALKGLGKAVLPSTQPNPT